MSEIVNGNKYGSVELELISQFESANDVVLPDDYKNFLLKYNGGEPKPAIEPTIKSDVQWIYGMVSEPYFASLFQHLDTFQGRLPSWYIPIANDSGGNLYVMSLYEENHGVIAFWSHENEAEEGQADQYFDNMQFVAPSFTDFLNQLVDHID
ncbi:SMI1/KNR4 family protein [Terrimonas pollutisoli]|uniref:SMI1/KNR4 family protein n=1 Tax=Terrimonas pollutisoli TaxID=3034147 RepID=UPI0023ECB225|nr:SMI1/KNR4 family protein [Terrimonas sp. H1YJ31]